MSKDVRYERDIYTWLTALELSQYYFMFKGAGMEKIRDVLYLHEEDIIRVGVEDPEHIRKLMVGVRHIIVPDKMLVDNRYSAVFQSGRLVVDIFSFLDYSTMIRSTRVNKFWRACLNKGVRSMTISNPIKLGAPVKHVLCQFSSLTSLNGFKFGPEGGVSLAQGLVSLTKKSEIGSPLLSVNLMASRMRNKGVMAVADAMTAGGMTRLQKLNLSTNNMQHKGVISLSKCLACKRHRGLLELDLSYNGFGDPGMDALSDAIAAGATPALERLRLASVGMSDVGFAALCEPLATRSLIRLLVLDVRWNPKMRDRAGKRMMVVVSYQGTPHLQVFNMRGHRMSPRTVKLLTDACDGYFDLIC